MEDKRPKVPDGGDVPDQIPFVKNTRAYRPGRAAAAGPDPATQPTGPAARASARSGSRWASRVTKMPVLVLGTTGAAVAACPTAAYRITRRDKQGESA